MNTIKEYFDFYLKIKQNQTPLRKFSFLDRQLTLVKYLKQNKVKIIKSINYAFFASDENVLLSVFCKDNIYFIHINSRLTKDYYPSNFSNSCEYENYLAIYGTFSVLIDFSFQAQELDDSRIFYKDFLEDLTFKIYYDDDFRLNLQDLIDQENAILKYVYRYGYDFLLEFFKLYFQNSSKTSNAYLTFINFLKIKESEFNELFGLYRAKIILENQ